jgi:hypothetical protein
MTPEQKAALERLKNVGQRLAKGSSWNTRLATIWKRDENGEFVETDAITLDTGDLKALADLEL